MSYIARSLSTFGASAALIAIATSPAAFAADTPAPTNPVNTSPSASAPATAVPKVAAQAHIRYTVNGLTVKLYPYVTGTQHEMSVMGTRTRSALPYTFTMDWPTSAKWTTGNAAGDAGVGNCTSTGVVKLSSVPLSGDPITLTFPKAGTYPVTMRAGVCTDQGMLSKTVNVTVGSTKAQPSGPASSAPSTPASTSPTKGPKVETDYVGDTTDRSLLGLSAAGWTAVAVTGVAVARRRRVNSVR